MTTPASTKSKIRTSSNTLWDILDTLPESLSRSQVVSWFAGLATDYRKENPPPETPKELLENSTKKSKKTNGLDELVQNYSAITSQYHAELMDVVVPKLIIRISDYANARGEEYKCRAEKE